MYEYCAVQTKFCAAWEKEEKNIMIDSRSCFFTLAHIIEKMQPLPIINGFWMAGKNGLKLTYPNRLDITATSRPGSINTRHSPQRKLKDLSELHRLSYKITTNSGDVDYFKFTAWNMMIRRFSAILLS
ncbi:MAG: hypothetical protein CSA29_03650 [Desulfobacterales bacterium]|nr:MAG: hypothetical protein CSA29_03650 [Desulfobacterales bacterium]